MKIFVHRLLSFVYVMVTFGTVTIVLPNPFLYAILTPHNQTDPHVSFGHDLLKTVYEKSDENK